MKLLPLLLGVIFLVLIKETEEAEGKSKGHFPNEEGETEEPSFTAKLKELGKDIKEYVKSTAHKLVDWAANKLKPKT